MPSRQYMQGRRAASAAHTRARIVDAAAELFVHQGYSRTTVSRIAAEAGVSVQTVHNAGNKAALMTAALRRAFAGDEDEGSLLDRPEFVAIMADEDTGRAIDRYVQYVVDANARIADLWHAASLASDSDAAIGSGLAIGEARRLADIRAGSGWFVHRGVLPADGVDEFVDVLGYLTSPATHRYFHRECGWNAVRMVHWLRRALGHHLERTTTPRSSYS